MSEAVNNLVQCPECVALKDWTEFLLSPRNPLLSAFCGECRERLHDVVGRMKSGPAEWRRRVLATLRELAAKNKEGRMAEDQAVAMSRLPRRIAEIVARTYAILGDDAILEDDTALGEIRDLLDELDQDLIEQATVKARRLVENRRRRAG